MHSIAKKLNAKILPNWRGIVKTISGSEQRELEVYQLSIRKECGNFTTLQCYGCDEIAHKPAIETVRYKRLLEAYNLSEDDVDNSSGQVGLMLGLKCQRLQTSKVKKFYSDTFPEVGVYESPALDKMILVGATEAQLSEAMLTTYHRALIFN